MDELTAVLEGEVVTSLKSRQAYSHDASLFELLPDAVVFPKNTDDLRALTKIAAKYRAAGQNVSITPRGAGTDMSGGAIGQSLVVDFTRYFNRITAVSAESATVQPGVYYRDFESTTLKNGTLLPSYPASRDLCTVGGMVSNNAGGEKSLQWGKTANFVQSLRVVLSDGNLYTIKPLDAEQLRVKMAQPDFEGRLYRDTYRLLEDNYQAIQAARPRVSKDSTGYHLWDVWNRQSGVFDLTKLFVGAQGTLGLITEINFKLVPKPRHSGLLVCFLKDTRRLGDIINAVLEHRPATFESFDDNTLWLSFKFFPAFLKTLGLKRWLQLAAQLLPDGLMLLRGVPKLILMIEFNGETPETVAQKIEKMRQRLKPFGMAMEKDETEFKSQKFWIMRRQSFNLLRQKVKDKHTAPFIDDLVVPPPCLNEFLPKLRRIIKKYRLLATIAGHMGDGNFHIIPLMRIEDPAERAKLEPAMKEVNKLVLSYGGSLSGEHNDGMVRGPWLGQMYGESMVNLMRQIKRLYDPQNIFNPHKKTDARWQFSLNHIRKSF
ncbi:MAG: FAD-binding oxidoreductase [Candidatus Chaera renei]|uniref:D-lactate dehydrogenase (cytochrome) n=1 Tax=Candidatus Chaera renei TaxID=2506947 RepID=A0A4Q0AIN9_9BACT|nr:MAG: FAD-binding oxidoreductase [Candidatus Chaera renei]